MATFYELTSCCTGMVLAFFSNSKGEILRSVRDRTEFRGYRNTLTHAVVIATTTARQRVAKEALAEMGFVVAGEYNKDGNRGSRHTETGGITLHTIHAHDLWDWIVKARAERDQNAEAERARLAEIAGRRRFGGQNNGVVPGPINPAVAGPRIVPSCTMRSMKRMHYIHNWSGADNNLEIRNRVRNPFVEYYGLTEWQYNACLLNRTIGEFAREVRDCQLRNQMYDQIRIAY